MIELVYPNFDQLFWNIPSSEWKRIEKLDHYFDAQMCPESLTCGYDTYLHLSKIIPKHFEIYDFGCGYAFQAWHFKDHEKYHGIDYSAPYKEELLKYNSDYDGIEARLKLPNIIHYDMIIAEWIKNNLGKVNQKDSFAIINYVPDWHGKNTALIKKSFKNVFAFYPSTKTIKI